jgi:hypothetical protein
MSDEQILKAEISDLKAVIEDLEHQLKNREAERDLLAVMLNEAENTARRIQGGPWPNRDRPHAAGEFEHNPATAPENRRVTIDQLLRLVEQMSPDEQAELERRLRAKLNPKLDDGGASAEDTP